MGLNVIKRFDKRRMPRGALQIHLCDTSEGMVDAFLEHFGDVAAVQVIRDDILKLRCDAIVSPANSFGDMDGGLDKHIDDFFHHKPQSRAKQAIADQCYGELPVGMALVIPLDERRFRYLISAPTMRLPGSIAGTINAYLAMRGLLVAVLQHNQTHSKLIRTLAVPGMGAGVGRLPYHQAAQQMRVAYDNIIGEGWREVFYSAVAPFSLFG